jgi:[ribosomal protein S5]-alanine N-acetyltransferase
MEVSLRPWTLNDKEVLANYANNNAIASRLMNTFPHPYSIEDAVKFITYASSAAHPTLFAILYNDDIVGGIGYHPLQDIFCKNAELGYWVAEPFWNKGIVTQAIPLIVEKAFANEQFTRIFARPFGTNTASQKVLEKCGFVLEARFEKTIFKNGSYEDELVYAIRRS